MYVFFYRNSTIPTICGGGNMKYFPFIFLLNYIMLPLVRGIRRRNRRLAARRRLRNPNIITTTEKILLTNTFTKHFYTLSRRNQYYKKYDTYPK